MIRSQYCVFTSSLQELLPWPGSRLVWTMPEQSKCSTAQILLGRKNNNDPPSGCHVAHGVISTIITTVFRIILLLFLLYGGNSITIQLYPPVIWESDTCEELTVVQSAHGFTYFKRSIGYTEMFCRNLVSMEQNKEIVQVGVTKKIWGIWGMQIIKTLVISTWKGGKWQEAKNIT